MLDRRRGEALPCQTCCPVSVETSESLLRLEEAGGQGPKHGETRAVFFGSAFAKETAKLCIGNVVVSVADFGAHGTHAHSINHSAGVAVIPVFDS